jgi:hypothetical protein
MTGFLGLTRSQKKIAVLHSSNSLLNGSRGTSDLEQIAKRKKLVRRDSLYARRRRFCTANLKTRPGFAVVMDSYRSIAWCKIRVRK